MIQGRVIVRLNAVLFLSVGMGCQREDGAMAGVACVPGSDSARAAQVALDTAGKLMHDAYVVTEFRCERGGYSILTVPATTRRMDRSLTVQVSEQLRVIGFGPDSV